MGWLMFFLLLDIAPLQAREEVDGYFTVTGVVRNKDDRKKLENVNVSVPGTNIGTVTNSDGLLSHITNKYSKNVRRRKSRKQISV